MEDIIEYVIEGAIPNSPIAPRAANIEYLKQIVLAHEVQLRIIFGDHFVFINPATNHAVGGLSNAHVYQYFKDTNKDGSEYYPVGRIPEISEKLKEDTK